MYPRVCNQFLEKKWKRQLPVHSLAASIHSIDQRMLRSNKHTIPWPHGDKDIRGILRRTEPRLDFIQSEEEVGNRELVKLGVPYGNDFVCFYARDAAYLDATHAYRTWEYHDYRDASIDNYIPAVQELVERGCYAIRMGSITNLSLSTDDARIIDYSCSGTSDFMDVFLSAMCKFFISSTGGINAVPRIFRKPIVYVNFVPVNKSHLLICTPYSLIIPKKIWREESQRYLTFREMISEGVNNFYQTSFYTQAGLQVHENTPEEIMSVVIEMERRLDGSWCDSEQDEKLQQRFWSLISPEGAPDADMCRIGAAFLRENIELLD